MQASDISNQHKQKVNPRPRALKSSPSYTFSQPAPLRGGIALKRSGLGGGDKTLAYN